jgi:hypothetical protein
VKAFVQRTLLIPLADVMTILSVIVALFITVDCAATWEDILNGKSIGTDGTSYWLLILFSAFVVLARACFHWGSPGSKENNRLFRINHYTTVSLFGMCLYFGLRSLGMALGILLLLEQNTLALMQLPILGPIAAVFYLTLALVALALLYYVLSHFPRYASDIRRLARHPGVIVIALIMLTPDIQDVLVVCAKQACADVYAFSSALGKKFLVFGSLR